MDYKKSTILQKKLKMLYRFKMAAKWPIFISWSFRFWPKFEKPLSQKHFLMKFGLKVGDHEYIYITEITFKKKLFRFKMAAKTIFWYCAIMLIYAN